MQEWHDYEYAIIRVVPRVEREEFLNLGVLLFCRRKRFLGMRYAVQEERLRNFAPQLDISELKQYLRAWSLVIDGDKEGGRIAELELSERFRWLSAAKSTILQCSAVHPGRCTEPAILLDRLLDLYVL